MNITKWQSPYGSPLLTEFPSRTSVWFSLPSTGWYLMTYDTLAGSAWRSEVGFAHSTVREVGPPTTMEVMLTTAPGTAGGGVQQQGIRCGQLL